MSPCCQQLVESESIIYGNLNSDSFFNLWNGESIRNLRLKMLNNEKCEYCNNCYEHESANLRSLRKLSNSKYHKYLDWVVDRDDLGYVANAKPIYWDIRFYNLCNLRCRTSNDCWLLGLDSMYRLNKHM